MLSHDIQPSWNRWCAHAVHFASSGTRDPKKQKTGKAKTAFPAVFKSKRP